jgi:hypothetical protein
MHLVGARPQTFSCVVLDLILFVCVISVVFSLYRMKWMHLVICLMMQGLHISVEKSGSDVVLPINKKVLVKFFHFYKNVEFPKKMQ